MFRGHIARRRDQNGRGHRERQSGRASAQIQTEFRASFVLLISGLLSSTSDRGIIQPSIALREMDMPELPEVETVVRDLRPMLLGRRLDGLRRSKSAADLRLGWKSKWGKSISGRVFNSARRRGKWIILEFVEGGCFLAHLGMTGQLTVVPAHTERDGHCHLEFALDNQTKLRYRDVRRFGGIVFCDHVSKTEVFLAERLGPEPWDLKRDAWHGDLTASNR